jgi:glycosyltransferase involved in cell wall biosynthesis
MHFFLALFKDHSVPKGGSGLYHEQMKILITIENAEMDGTKRAAIKLGNTLYDQKMDLSFYSLENVAPYFTIKAPLITAAHPAASNVLNFRGSNPYEKYGKQIADLITYLKYHDFDAVILTAGLLTSFAPLIKKELPQLKLIAWMHNNFKTYVDQYYVEMHQEFVAGLHAADAVVTLTDSDLQNYRQINPQTVKIYNPLTLAPERSADLNRHLIAFTGRIAIEHKGIDLLLAAAQYLPADWKIAIAGSGEPADMQRFRNLITKFDVADKIIYRGALKDQALQEHYESASIFISTSRWEGMPLVIGEAMAFGLPVIAMENTGSSEFIQANSYGVLTKPQDVTDFVRILQRFMQSRFLRRYYGNRSLERISQFAPVEIGRQWIELVKSLSRTYEELV